MKLVGIQQLAMYTAAFSKSKIDESRQNENISAIFEAFVLKYPYNKTLEA